MFFIYLLLLLVIVLVLLYKNRLSQSGGGMVEEVENVIKLKGLCISSGLGKLPYSEFLISDPIELIGMEFDNVDGGVYSGSYLPFGHKERGLNIILTDEKNNVLLPCEQVKGWSLNDDWSHGLYYEIKNMNNKKTVVCPKNMNNNKLIWDLKTHYTLGAGKYRIWRGANLRDYTIEKGDGETCFDLTFRFLCGSSDPELIKHLLESESVGIGESSPISKILSILSAAPASSPASPSPAAPSPAPVSSTPAPSTPAPSTPASTPASFAPASSTPASSTPASSTPASSTPASSTPASSTPASSTPPSSTSILSALFKKDIGSSKNCYAHDDEGYFETNFRVVSVFKNDKRTLINLGGSIPPEICKGDELKFVNKSGFTVLYLRNIIFGSSNRELVVNEVLDIEKGCKIWKKIGTYSADVSSFCLSLPPCPCTKVDNEGYMQTGYKVTGYVLNYGKSENLMLLEVVGGGRPKICTGDSLKIVGKDRINYAIVEMITKKGLLIREAQMISLGGEIWKKYGQYTRDAPKSCFMSRICPVTKTSCDVKKVGEKVVPDVRIPCKLGGSMRNKRLLLLERLEKKIVELKKCGVGGVGGIGEVGEVGEVGVDGVDGIDSKDLGDLEDEVGVEGLMEESCVLDSKLENSLKNWSKNFFNLTETPTNSILSENTGMSKIDLDMSEIKNDIMKLDNISNI